MVIINYLSNEKKKSNFIEYSLYQAFCIDYYVIYCYQCPQEGTLLLSPF